MRRHQRSPRGDSAARRLHAEVDESERKYRTLLTEMADGFALHELVTGPDGSPVDYVTLEANPAFEQLVGVRCEDFLNRPVSQLLPAEELRRWLDVFAPVAQGGPPRRYEDFSPRYGRHFRGYVYSPKRGQFATLVEDVTERKLAEARLVESQKKFQALVETTSDFIWEMDARGTYTYCSPQIETLWGLDPGDMVGRSPFDLMTAEERARVLEGFAALKASRSPFRNLETRTFDAHGKTRILEVSGVPFFDAGGELAGYRGVTRDITERKQAEAALAASEARFREIFAASPIAIEIYDAQGRLLDMNRACLDLFGVVEAADVQGFRLFEDPNLPADARERLARDETVRYECAFDFERVKREALYRTTRSGVAHLAVSIAPLGSPAAPHGYLVQVLDHTERMRAEEALRESDSRYKLLFDAIPESVLLIGADGRVETANWASARLYGWESPEQLQGFPTPLLIAERDRQRAKQTQASVIQGREPPARRYTEVRRDGSEFIAEVTSTTLHGPQQEVTGYIGITRDITALVTAEEATRDALLRFQFALRSAHQGVWDWDLRTNAMVWDDEMLGLYGLTRDQFTGDFEAWKRALHPEDRDRAVADVQAAVDGTREFDAEYRVVQRDGTVKHIKADGLVLRAPDGTATRMLGLNQDITERKRAEQALQESNARYRALVESSMLGIGISRGERVVYANPALLEMLGYSSLEEVERTSLMDHIAEGSKPLVRERMAARERGDPPSPRWEYQCVRTDGTVRDVEALSTTIIIDGEAHTLTTSRDITDIKNAEEEKARLREQLSHAQKMEAIGTLAGGVAHDFNNFLGGVLTGLSTLELELGDIGDRQRADLKELKELVRSGAGLSQQLLGFSQRGKYDVAPRDVRKIVQKTADLFARTRRDITVALDLAPDLDRAIVDHTQLEQVLLNLFINAAHAMPEGGRLTIRGDNATLTPAEAEPHGATPGRFVRLVVADTGTGIDPAILPRIFEPFFTTKAPGHGSGLGLASVYGIVKNHGGVITVESELGKGTAFTVLLPATDEAPAETPAPPAAVAPAHGTILVVDDDERMLRSMARLLGVLGYEVLTAPGGRAAVELVREHRERISLVILDMTMPEMSGAATFDAIRELSPALKVLLSSGYSIDGQAQALLDRGCNGFIQKPFDETTLSEKIQALR